MIQTNFDPMPDVDSLAFKKEYISVLKNKEKDLTLFFVLISSFITSMEESLRNNKDSFFLYIFLKKNISSLKIPISFLDIWISEPTFKQDVRSIICQRLRNGNTIPHNATPVMAKYYFVTDLRLAFSNFLKKRYRFWQRNKKNNNNYSTNYYEIEPFEKINSNFWRNYLLFMLKLGYSITDISKLTGYSRVTLYKELKNDN